MTIAQQVYALWALLRPEQVQFANKCFVDPWCEIPPTKCRHIGSVRNAKGALEEWFIWTFEDGSSITRIPCPGKHYSRLDLSLDLSKLAQIKEQAA